MLHEASRLGFGASREKRSHCAEIAAPDASKAAAKAAGCDDIVTAES